jgi:hypothetical protein
VATSLSIARADTEAAVSLAGQWEADLPVEDGMTSRMLVDLGTLGSRWVGEFDLAEFGVENYPVEVSTSDERVSLHFTGIDMDLEGRLEDGSRLSGTAKFGEEQVPLVFRRVAAEPQFSGDFLALEAVADDLQRVTKLSAEGTQLRDRFNADQGKTRLVMLLSPT